MKVALLSMFSLLGATAAILNAGGAVRRGVVSRGARSASCNMAVAPCGFIGLGIMGQGMARQLRAAGIPLVVWTRSVKAAEDLAAEAAADGGSAVTVADSAQAVVEACARTFVMLPTPDAVHELYHQEDGVLAGVSKGKQIVDCATLRVEDMEALSEAVHRRGGLFAEAPVSGSKGPAATGQLVFLVGGDEEVYKAATAEWDAMGKATVYCGAVGKGTQLKLVVNMVMGTQLAALAEGLALGKSLGLDGGDLQRVLELGAMSSPMLALKGPLMAKGDYAPNFPLKCAATPAD